MPFLLGHESGGAKLKRQKRHDCMDSLHVEHIGLWVRDLERMRQFYVRQLGGQSGPLYENPRTGFCSYFIKK
jgi:hypothetical protein